MKAREFTEEQVSELARKAYNEGNASSRIKNHIKGFAVILCSEEIMASLQTFK
jgi:hypothetical protein